MGWSVFGMIVFAVSVALLARRERIMAWLDRLEARQRAEAGRIAALRRHPHGHMALTIEHIAAQTPAVEVTWIQDGPGAPRTQRFIWNGVAFDLQEDAEQARLDAILRAARAYYADLDRKQVTTTWTTARPNSPSTGPGAS